MDSALRFYECAQDYLSLVRVHCYMGNIQKVTQFVFGVSCNLLLKKISLIMGIALDKLALFQI